MPETGLLEDLGGEREPSAGQDAEGRSDVRSRVWRKRTVLASAAILVGLIVAALTLGANVGNTISGPRQEVPDFAEAHADAERVDLRVEAGMSLTDIGGRAAGAGIVASELAFVRAAAQTSGSDGVQPGVYRLPRGSAAAPVVAALIGRGPLSVPLVDIPEGFTLDQIVTRLGAQTGLDADALKVAAAASPREYGADPSAMGLEGWLAPARYAVAPGDTARQVLSRMVGEQSTRLLEGGSYQSATQAGLTLSQFVTMASIAQAEAIAAQRPQVARVVLNRLAAGMPMQMDSTVNYALHQSKLRVSLDELDTKSPYNTYRVKGLPPTPIGAVSTATLAALRNVPAGDWLYFVLVKADGTSVFTADYPTFLAAKAKAQAEGVY